jgi:hypothetical protein
MTAASLAMSPDAANTNLEFGTRVGATDSFDTGVDVPHPPPAPGATFDAYFSITHVLFTQLDKDYRAPLTCSDTEVWTLRVWSTSGAITLTWDASQICACLNARLNTGTQTINMKTQSSLNLPVGDYTLIITVSGETCVDIPLKAGWNMVSVPVIPSDTSVGIVFPGAAAVYTWDPVSASYIMPAIVEPCKGYWVAVAADTTIHVCGAPVSTCTTNIKSGWNMIGSLFDPASIANPNDNPDGCVQAFAYWWNPVSAAYVMTTDIQPGKGYWVASMCDCTLTMP